MQIILKHRWTNDIILQTEAASLRLALETAVRSGSDLRGSDLSGSDLRGSNLRGSNLRGSDLSGSDLRGSDLRGSNLRGSDLRDSDLSGSDLRGSDLSGSNLRDSDLTPVRDDLWAVLSASPHEVSALRVAIAEGRIDGSSYQGGCACLVGTLANARHCTYQTIPGLRPDGSRPAERFFLSIKIGDTPATSQFSSLALKWVETWLTNMHAAFGGNRKDDHAPTL